VSPLPNAPQLHCHLVVLLCYVGMLNLVVARFLFQKGATPHRTLAFQARAAQASLGAGPANDSLAPSEPALEACMPHAFTDVAVRLRRLWTPNSNEVAPAPTVLLPVLSELQRLLLAQGNAHHGQAWLPAGSGSANSVRVRVWLVVRPEDFLALFCLWCVALGVDSKGRCQCEVLFTKPAQHAAIAWLLVHLQPCAERLYLLDKGLALPHGPLPGSLAPASQAPAPLLLGAGAAPGCESLLLTGCFLHACVRCPCLLAPDLTTDADLAAFAVVLVRRWRAAKHTATHSSCLYTAVYSGRNSVVCVALGVTLCYAVLRCVTLCYAVL